jgi:hypothetical protein
MCFSYTITLTNQKLAFLSIWSQSVSTLLNQTRTGAANWFNMMELKNTKFILKNISQSYCFSAIFLTTFKHHYRYC